MTFSSEVVASGVEKPMFFFKLEIWFFGFL